MRIVGKLSKKRFIFFSFLLFFISSVDASSLFLINDTPFKLTARVESQGGAILGTYKMEPYEQKTVTVDVSSFSAGNIGSKGYLLTPFTVVWMCETKGQYGIETNVSPSASVRATLSSGKHFCEPPEKKEKEEKS